MAKNIVALYIDDTSIRLLTTTGRQVKRWANLSLEAGLVKDGVIVDEAEVAAKVNELLRANRVTAREVVVGLSGLHCLCRVVTLPRLSKTLLAEAVRREAERVVPVPLDQLYLSWQTISTLGKEMQVFIAAFPRNSADALIRTLRQAGVEPYLVDLAPLSLARVVNEATAIIVDVRSTEADIIVMVDRVPQLIRTLSFPSEAQTKQEKLLTVKEEIDRTLKFYNSSHSENPLESNLPIYVSGELAQMSQEHQSLSDELGHPVLPLSSPLKCSKQLDSGHYMVNTGLVLKELSPAKRATSSVVNLNTLPEAQQPEASSPAKILTAAGIVVATGLLVLTAIFVRSTAADTASLQTQLDSTGQLLKQKQTQQQSQKEAIAELEQKVADIEATYITFADALDDFDQQQEIGNNNLDTVTSALPSTVNLSDIINASDELTISGTSPSEADILEYATTLRGSGRFSQVIVTNIEQAEEGMTFILTLRS